MLFLEGIGYVECGNLRSYRLWRAENRACRRRFAGMIGGSESAISWTGGSNRGLKSDDATGKPIFGDITSDWRWMTTASGPSILSVIRGRVVPNDRPKPPLRQLNSGGFSIRLTHRLNLMIRYKKTLILSLGDLPFSIVYNGLGFAILATMVAMLADWAGSWLWILALCCQLWWVV